MTIPMSHDLAPTIREFQAVYRSLESGIAGPVMSEPKILNGIAAASPEQVEAMLKDSHFVVLQVTETRVLPHPLCAKDQVEASGVLGVSPSTLWKLCNLPKRDPRRINRTSYGKIPFSELARHVAAEVAAAA